MRRIRDILPWLILSVFVIYMIAVLWPKREGEWHTAAFGRLPVLLNGRIQPLDSVGRNALLQIRSTGDLPLEIVPGWQFWRHPKKLRSSEWLLEVMFKPEVADTRPVFLAHHPELIGELKLDDKGIERSGLRYYSFDELEPVIDEIMAQGNKAAKFESAQRTPYQQQVLKLAHAVNLYHRLKNSIHPEGMHSFGGLVARYREILPVGLKAIRDHQAGQEADQESLRQLASMATTFESVQRAALPLVVPPVDPADREGWQDMGTHLLGALRGGEIHAAVDAFARMSEAYAHGEAKAFNETVAGYAGWLNEHFPREAGKGRAEFYFNRIKLFLHATIIYIAAFVLAGGALLLFGVRREWARVCQRAAFGLVGLAFVIHTAGLIYRMMLEGRPPVTNLYSSAIFIGWGTCVLGLILERVYRVGLGSAVAGLAGFVTLLIAHNLALGGDTMEMLRAVLDTNFWLATHVVVITLGYSASFVAGGLAMAYIILGVFTPVLAMTVDEKARVTLGTALVKMTYAIVCFGLLFNFTGTVLGGIWADQSWGRFWGWDPKENGALLIVIWQALILHARWGGLVRERGMMNLAVFGNVVTAWSWFGTNMLGIGLHSYGFMDAGFRWLMYFWATQVVVILIGLIPVTVWRSGPTSGKAATVEPVTETLDQAVN